jgi:hypothetical protein
LTGNSKEINNQIPPSPQKLGFTDVLGLRSDSYFKWLLAIYLVISIINASSYVIGVERLDFMALAYPHWWSVFTSILLFDSPSSVLALIFSVLLLAFANGHVARSRSRNRTILFMFSTLAISFLANLLWYLLPSNRNLSSFGASQIDYSADAFLIVFCCFNLLFTYSSSSPHIMNSRLRGLVKNQDEGAVPKDSLLKSTWTLVNLVILVSLILVTFVAPPTLFQNVVGINTFDHKITFLLSLPVALVGEVLYDPPKK